MASPPGFSRKEVDKAFAERKGPWLMGEQFTLADVL